MARRRVDKGEARRLRARGLGHAEIAAKLGFTESAISHVLRDGKRNHRKATWLRLVAQTQGVQGSDCIVWTGHVRESGYATIQHEGRKQLVHRVAYQLIIGPIPEGLEIDHTCFVRHCVNPFHLEAVTPLVNTMRSSSVSKINALKTHCDFGHEFTPENTYLRRDRRGRLCRACGARRAREIRERRAAA